MRRLTYQERRVIRFIKPVLIKQCGGKCMKCGNKNKLTVDHIIPLSKGGHPTSKKNLQILCEGCNKNKGSKITSNLIINGIDYNALLDKLRIRIFTKIDKLVAPPETITDQHIKELLTKWNKK